MTQYGFFFDSTRCTGCRTCEMACKDYKDLSATIAFRKVYDYEGGAWSDAGDGTFTSDAFAYHVSLGCQHCAMPACMAKCPQGAIEKDTKAWCTSTRKNARAWAPAWRRAPTTCPSWTRPWARA